MLSIVAAGYPYGVNFAGYVTLHDMLHVMWYYVPLPGQWYTSLAKVQLKYLMLAPNVPCNRYDHFHMAIFFVFTIICLLETYSVIQRPSIECYVECRAPLYLISCIDNWTTHTWCTTVIRVLQGLYINLDTWITWRSRCHDICTT